MQLRRWLKSKTDGSNFLTSSMDSMLCAFSFTQIVASDTWVIQHNNNSIILAIQVYIDDELVEPDDITINDLNTFTISFSESLSGVVNFLLYKVGGDIECVIITPTPSITPTQTVTPTVTPTSTVTPSVTATATVTPTPTQTATPSITATVTPSVTVTPTYTPTPTITPSNTPLPVVAAWAAGGSQPLGTDSIDSFPFASPFTVATNVGSLNSAVRFNTGNASTIDGYSNNTPGLVMGVETFPFVNPFTTATDLGDLSQDRDNTSGQNSSIDGYHSGGISPAGSGFGNEVDTIDNFPFSSPFTVATDVGNLSVRRNVSAKGDSQSSSDGYAIGGRYYNLPVPSPQIVLSSVDRFPFGTPFTTATDIGNISVAGYGSSVSTDGEDAWVSASHPNPTTNRNVERFPFSTPFTSSTNVGVLSTPWILGGGHNSETDGYVGGGRVNVPLAYNTSIDRYPFATPFTTATDIGDYFEVRTYHATMSS